LEREVEDLKLKRRCLEIAYKNKLSHLGSYFSSLDIIDKIYGKMKEDDIFILSSGHAALALYVVLEKYKKVDAEMLLKKHGCHPKLDEQNYIYCSTGSLGMGLTVAVGRALANKTRKVYCLISDGECAEGSIWESLSFIKQNNLKNIEIHVNINGYCAYDLVDKEYLKERLTSFLPDVVMHETFVEHFSFLKGLNSHYHIMSEENYNTSLKELL
jgi:transketolase